MAKSIGTVLIDIKANTQELIQGFNRAEQRVNSSISTMKNSIIGLTSAYLSFNVVFGGGKLFLQQAEALTNTTSRLKLVTSSSQELLNVQKQLFDLSNRARVGYLETVDLFTNISNGAREYNIEQSKILQISEAISKSTIISGSSAAATQAALTQLGQAFSSNFKSVGQELGSLREQAPRLYRAMAEGLGVTSDKFKKMAEDGKLSTEVIVNALLKASKQIDIEYSSMTKTVGQELTLLSNQSLNLIGNIDNKFEISSTTIAGIKEVTETIASIGDSLNNLSSTEIENITTQFKNMGIAVVGSYVALKSAKAVYSGYTNVLEFVNNVNTQNINIEKAKSKALYLSEKATIARTLADQAYNTKTAAGIELNKTQILQLQKQAVLLETQARKQNSYVATLEATKTRFDAAAVGAYALRTALSTIPFMMISAGIASIATSILSASKNTEIWEKTITATKEELEKLTSVQLEARIIIADDEIKKQAKEVGKLFDKTQDSYYDTFASWLDKDKAKSLNLGKFQDEVDKLQELVEKRRELFDILNKPKETSTQSENKVDKVISNDDNEKTQKELDAINKAYLDIAQIGMSEYEKNLLAITQKTQTWIDAGIDLEYALEAQNKVIAELNNKDIDDTYDSMLEAQLRLNEATMDWNNNLTGTSAALADVSTAMAKLGKISIVNEQEKAKLDKKYNEDKKKNQGNSIALQKIEEKYIKDKGVLEKNNTNAMLKGYSDLAGAMSTLFKDGSKEQAAFQIAQTSLALIEGTRAVLSAGTGDPYTAPARMVAMAAMVAPLLKNIGVMFGMNKNSESWDEFSKQEANIGAGSLLGDSKTASDSINNSLESLSDYAKPQFEVLKDMNKAVQNINANIVGVTRLLISNSDFAMGKDFVGFDSGWRDNSFSKAFQSFDNAIGDALGKDLKKVFDVTGFGLINKGLGAIAGGLFGKKSTTISLHDSGLTFNAMNLEDALDGIIGRQYQVNKREEKKKSWFGSSTKTYYDSYFKALDDETSRQFTLVLNSLYDTVLSSGEALDVASNETAKNLSSFVVNLGKISLKGKTGAQIQELLGNVFSKLGDDLVKTAFTTGEFKFEEKLKGKDEFYREVGLKGMFAGTKSIHTGYQNYLDEYNSRKNQAYQKWLQTANPLLGFQQIGEGMFETLQRVGMGIEESKYYIKRLGADFESINYLDINNKQGNVGFEALFQSITKFEEATFPLNNNLMLIIDGLELTAEELFEIYTNLDELRDRLIYLGHDYQGLSNDMITGAGSVGALSDGFKDFFDNFLSDEEQLQFKTEQLRESFETLGLALPNSKDEFRGLLDSMDLTTASGQELYGRLIILSKTFAKISDETTAAIEELNSVNLDSFINSIDRITGTLNSLKDTALGFINSFDTSSTDLTANLIQYNQKRAEFESAFENGSLKDDADLNKVKSVYQELANLSKNIATADDDLKYSLINQFQSDIEDFDFANDVLKVSIVDGLKPILDLSNQQTQILTTLFNGTATSSDLFDQIASYLDFKSTDTSYDEVALTMLERLSSYMSFDISKILEDIRVQASKNKLLNLNSFAVGSTNIEYDQLAQIHKGEVIVPKTFSDGLRAGNITLGDNNNIVKEIKNLININIQGFNEIKKMRKEIEDIREAI